jgi:iron complex transport system substrate-binding protein
VEIAGGEPIFPELRYKRLAKDRIVREDDVLERRPDVILASWCGKKMKKSTRSRRADRGREADLRAPGVDVS